MIVGSTRALPELSPVARKRAHLHIRWPGSRPNLRSFNEIHRWTIPGGRVWLAIGETAAGYLFRFRQFGDFCWTANQRLLTCHVRRGVQMRTIRHLLLDQVLPVLASRGEINGLHASAVVVDGGAVVFAGETGKGKSTLAALFAAAGYPVVTDDCLLLHQRRSG